MLVSGKVDTYFRSLLRTQMKVKANVGAVSRKWHIHLLDTLWGDLKLLHTCLKMCDWNVINETNNCSMNYAVTPFTQK